MAFILIRKKQNLQYSLMKKKKKKEKKYQWIELKCDWTLTFCYKLDMCDTFQYVTYYIQTHLSFLLGSFFKFDPMYIKIQKQDKQISLPRRTYKKNISCNCHHGVSEKIETLK